MVLITSDIFRLSANTLGQRLEGKTQEIWNQRDTFDVIVLMDWDTDDFNFAGSKIERLRICIVEVSIVMCLEVLIY